MIGPMSPIDEVQLHLLRHAHAGDPMKWSGPDEVRPLTEKGRQQSERLGLFMARAGFSPDAILTSPKTRAVETARLFAAAGGPGTRVAEPLRRIVDTPTQTTLDRKTRQANLKNAFALRKDADINPAERYVLIDDVFTTGSTLNACALAMRRAGGVNIDVVTFGHG